MPSSRNLFVCVLFFLKVLLALSTFLPWAAAEFRCDDVYRNSTFVRLTSDPFVDFQKLETEFTNLAQEISFGFYRPEVSQSSLQDIVVRLDHWGVLLEKLSTKLMNDQKVEFGEFTFLRRELRDIQEDYYRILLHQNPASTVTLPSANKPLRTLEVHRKAEKDIENLQGYLKEKYDEFVEEILRVPSLNELPSHWALEMLTKSLLITEQTYSVRLNHGYRVVFKFDAKEGVDILRISKTFTHH